MLALKLILILVLSWAAVLFLGSLMGRWGIGRDGRD